MEINEKLLKQIIPPIIRPDGKDREWFNNDEILSKLSKEELKIVEEQLIDMLKTSNDTLIPQTLIKLESLDSIPVMLEKLELIKDPFNKITWASFINEIKNGDKEMEQVAYREFGKLEFIYEVQGPIFHDLIKFKSERINNLINKFTDHKYFLVAHHAKLVLNHKGYAESYENKTRIKNWWKFWE
ncbi:hypothetical protein GCM10022393_34400 [Aquimarina addita]|uniref:Uncharacterized protein n=1 Tax=Aquimarina addita TaxID=870485 RepID=A0ABP6UQQ2_9FLAO